MAQPLADIRGDFKALSKREFVVPDFNRDYCKPYFTVFGHVAVVRSQDWGANCSLDIPYNITIPTNLSCTQNLANSTDEQVIQKYRKPLSFCYDSIYGLGADGISYTLVGAGFSNANGCCYNKVLSNTGESGGQVCTR